MTKQCLPEDVKQICVWLVRGYRRRKAAYHSAPMCTHVRERERVEAVERALLSVGSEVEAAAILLNVENERANPYHRLGVDFISRPEFYKRRDRFLADIAEQLGLI